MSQRYGSYETFMKDYEFALTIEYQNIRNPKFSLDGYFVKEWNEYVDENYTGVKVERLKK